MDLEEQLRHVDGGAVFLRRKFLPEGHWPAVSVNRLGHLRQANGRYFVLCKPPRDMDFPLCRCALPRSRDADNHAFGGKSPDLVFGQPYRLGAASVQADSSTGNFESATGGC